MKTMRICCERRSPSRQRRRDIYRDILEPFTGANNSTQYTVLLGYESLLDSHVEPVRIEVGLREPLLDEVCEGMAKTLLLNPLNNRSLVDVFAVNCLSYREAITEKIRAALCRREVAIRDFFDIDYAVRNGEVVLDDPELLAMLQRKLRIPGTEPLDVSSDRMSQLEPQMEAQLRPVVGEEEFGGFDLQRAIHSVRLMATKISEE